MNPPVASNLEVCILAGGLSSRMGRDKARLTLGGRTFLERIRQTAREIPCSRIRVQRRDMVPRCGPLGGILTALTRARRDWVLFLSCDMPFVSASLLREILAQADAHRQPIFLKEGGRAGFPFLLRRSELERVRAQVAEERYSLQALAAGISARIHHPTRAQRAELLNVNTPGEWERARQIWEAHAIRASLNTDMIKVDNLSIWRDRTHILSSVNWEVRKGEHWVLLGGNGSGKTSLLSALTGYLTPSAGKIVLLDNTFGRSDWRELRKRVGLVSSSIRQLMADAEVGLDTVVSGKYAMIDVWGAVTSRDRRKARRILAQIECTHLADRAWLYLSQGERQRILTGRALMANPKVLILDEPCAGLDPVARENFLQFIERLGRSEAAPTLVLVTHHVEEITPIFSHVLLLREGRVLAAGTRNKILSSKLLSETFGAPVRLRKNQGRYLMQVRGNDQVAV